DEHGTTQTSIRHHPPRRGARRVYAVAPIHTGGVAVRHGGPRDATWVPLSILTYLTLTDFAAPRQPGPRQWAIRTPLSIARRRPGRAGRAPTLPCHRPRVGARRPRPARPTPGRPLPPGPGSFHSHQALLPQGPPLQQRPHHPHQVVRRR